MQLLDIDDYNVTFNHQYHHHYTSFPFCPASQLTALLGFIITLVYTMLSFYQYLLLYLIKYVDLMSWLVLCTVFDIDRDRVHGS